MGAHSITISHLDPRTASDEELTRLNAFGNVLRAESKPDEPPTPVEVSIQGARNIPSFVEPHAYIAEADGTIVGSASGGILHTGENEHILQCGVTVHPEWRRQGIGWKLLEKMVELAESTDRRLLISTTTAKVPAGAAFAERLGANPGLVHRTSELDLQAVDRALVERWVAEGPGRAEGYELVEFVGAYPESEYQRIVDCLNVMNTAPRDDLEVDDMNTTVEQLAETEKALAAQGAERWAMFIRHRESGAFVGYTDVYWHPSNPKVVGQGGTAVDPAHRGHALGKWLKAAMILKVLDGRPEAALIRTSNAYTNDAMLGINNELGFEEKHAEIIWQLDVAKAREALTARS